MSGLQLTVTTAGFAAIVNAENTGTAPVRVTQIGVTDQALAPDAAMTALPGELKRLVTFAGDAVAADTVHVTIRDDSADVYSLRGFALYLEDGTLFGICGQADVILEKSSLALLLLSTDVRFVQVDATSLAFGESNWLNPPATTSVQGVVELATDAEAVAGADASRAVTPANVRAVLDGRLGAGAPSAFVKSLLTLATAALIRTALELGNAATRNEGAGNGLDADKLDGQHGAYYLAWANLTGKPATFAPSAHAHAWAEVTNPPATATRWPDWTEVTGKPATFAPSAHTHAAADITSGTFANARVAQGNVTQHQAALSIAWTQITGQPTTYPPSAHTHAIANITNLQTALNAKIDETDVDDTGTASTIAKRNASGDLFARLFRSTFANQVTISGALAFRVNDTTDNYIRFCSDTAAIRTWLGVPAIAHAHAIADVTNLQTTLNAKAPLANPVFTGTVTAPVFAQTSSRRYKRGIETIPADGALSLLSAVRFARYRLKADGSDQLGVIAEELADGPLDFVVERTGNGDPEAVNYQPLFVLACAALQGLSARVASLEGKL